MNAGAQRAADILVCGEAGKKSYLGCADGAIFYGQFAKRAEAIRQATAIVSDCGEEPADWRKL